MQQLIFRDRARTEEALGRLRELLASIPTASEPEDDRAG